jgi:NAD(P)-dependent dehydrogenase (short-subunit alcohol dehydrogenase family)
MSPSPVVRDYPSSAVAIAGGTSGVGFASAFGFASAGVRRLALLARDEHRGEAARRSLLDRFPEARVAFIHTDANDGDQVEKSITEAREALSGLDVLVNSVSGAYRPELLHRTAMAEVEGILLGQALPPMLLTRAALPYLREQGGGSIVNLASDAAKVPTPGESVLGGAMAAIVMFSRVAALEAKRDGIRINAVTPSLVAGTPTAENVLRDGFSRSLFDKAMARADLGVAEPDDLASLIVFLGGPGAARLTGQVVSVNGGISAG